MRPIPGQSRQVSLAVLAVFLLEVLLPSVGRADITLGQIDTFEDNKTQNWQTGRDGNPVVIPGGGPDGVDDRYLQLTAHGSGPQGRLTMFNREQWTGNYLAASVNAIEMDLKNFGDTPLSMRVGLKLYPGPGTPGFATTTGFLLPADGEWHHAVFLLDEEHLTRLNSTDLTLEELLSSAGELRVLNSRAPSLRGDFISGQVGVDNIAATSVPEPSGLALSLLAAGCLGLGHVLCRRRRRSASDFGREAA